MHEINAEEIGKELIQRKLISQEALDQALSQAKRGQPFDEAVLKTGVTENQFCQAMAKVLGLPFIDLSDYQIDPAIVGLISAPLAKEFCVFPLFKIRNSLMVAMADPADVVAMDRIREETGLEADPAVSERTEILNLINQHYGAGRSMGTLVETLHKKEQEKVSAAPEVAASAAESDQPVIQLVNLLLEHAVKERASDIHVEPDQDQLRVRIRIDGVLHEVPAPPKNFESSVISRTKILADMNIAENRVPQDGRFSAMVDGKRIDVRVSAIPTVHGENLVLRILDTAILQFDLKDLGFSPEALDRFKKLITRPYGMILVTGPTGSGKTTTLYTALRKINTPEKNIVTIEDPVEYRLEMIRQIQVNPKVGLTFATGLRSIVRQDPDIILVGEIRDLETAQIAIQSALTGHLVFSTLHTNDAAGASVRLMDMGVEPFLVASSVVGVMAQRLVRLICSKCKHSDSVPEAVLERFNLKGSKLMKGTGCRTCRQTGYRGRVGIFEILELNEDLRALIVARAPASQIGKEAVQMRMQTMLEDGLEKAKQGLTTLDEVLRVAETIQE